MNVRGRVNEKMSECTWAGKSVDETNGLTLRGRQVLL